MAVKADVVARAAQFLGRKRLGQDLAPEHNTRISSGYDEVYETLKMDGLATWAATGTVPDNVVPHMAALVAYNCLDTYSVSNDKYQRIEKAAAIAGPLLRSTVTPDYVSNEEPTDY